MDLFCCHFPLVFWLEIRLTPGLRDTYFEWILKRFHTKITHAKEKQTQEQHKALCIIHTCISGPGLLALQAAGIHSQQHCTQYTLPKMSPDYSMRQTAWAIFLNETTCTCPFLMRVSCLVKHWNPRSSLTCKITDKQAGTPTQMPPHKHTYKQVCALCFSSLPLFHPPSLPPSCPPHLLVPIGIKHALSQATLVCILRNPLSHAA